MVTVTVVVVMVIVVMMIMVIGSNYSGDDSKCGGIGGDDKE